jgi:rod shape-determining protein MreC
MREIVKYLVKIGYHLLFFALFGTSMYLIVNYNNTQKEIFINSSNILSSSISSLADRYEKYFELEKVNKNLQQQNAVLLQKMFEAGINATSIPDYKKDSAQQFEVIPVTICNSTFTLRNNNLTLCQGTNAGLKEDLGVITENGLVGIIRALSPDRARVMSILHTQSVIDCRLKNGGNPKLLDLTDVPKHIKVELGDTVVTSGFSTIFPKGLPVGKVVRVELPEGSNIFEISVEIFNDPAAVKYAYVIINKMTAEQKQLEAINE